MRVQNVASAAGAAALVVAGLVGNVRAAVSGSATHFTPGLGACGVTSGAGDMIVAVSPTVYAGGKHCKERMRVHYKSKSVEVTVLDKCMGCNDTHIDLGDAAFEKLADPELGLIAVTWDFVSDSSKDC